MFTKYGLPIIAIGLVIFAVVHVTSAQKTVGTNPPTTEPPRNPFASTVAGAGMIEAQAENIAIGSPVPGIVVEVQAKVGATVKPGAELFRLDDRQLRAELQFRQAALAASQAELTRLDNQPRPEQLQISKALVSEAQANFDEMRDQLNRTRELIARKVATTQDLVTREQAYRAAEAKLAGAKAEYLMQKGGAWEYDKAVARAAVAQARAQVEQVRIEIERLVVRAHHDGQVLQVNVRPGEFVGAPPSQALVVVGNVQQLHVRVDIDEYDIHRFKPGAPARAMLKGHPADEFPLTFVRVEPYVIPKRSLTGDNTERVDTRVLQVIYALDTQGEHLYVGQQLDVFIDTTPAEEAG